MFKLKPKCMEIEAAVIAVMDATKSTPLGSVLTWDAIDEMTGGIRPGHPKWSGFRSQLLARFRRERGVNLLHDRFADSGWLMLTPEQTLTLLPAKRMKKAARQAFMTQQAVESLDNTKLSLHERAMQARVIGRTKMTHSAIRRARKEALQPKFTHKPVVRPRPEPKSDQRSA